MSPEERRPPRPIADAEMQDAPAEGTTAERPPRPVYEDGMDEGKKDVSPESLLEMIEDLKQRVSKLENR